MEKRFDKSGYSRDKIRPLPFGKNERVIDLMKDELGELEVCCLKGKDIRL